MGTTMKGATAAIGGTLQATLCEIERGVFYATYADRDAIPIGELTHYQTGASAEEAKRSLELQAHSLGYDTVVWTETIVTPLFESEVEVVLREPGTAGVESRV